MAVDPVYLASLAALPPGDAARGEIQILSEPADIAAAAAVIGDKLSAAGLPPSCAEIGRVYTDPYVSIHRDAVRFADGSLGSYLRIHIGAETQLVQCVVLLVTKGGRTLLKRMFRHSTRAWELEFPRGGRGAGESLIDAGLSELREETGYLTLAAEPRVIGTFCVDSALRTSQAAVIHLPVTGLRDPDQVHPAESIDPAELWWSNAELTAAIASGRLRDGFTLSAWALARAHGIEPA